MLKHLLKSSGWIPVNKCLMRSLGTNEAIIFSELLNREEYFEIREELTEDGFFYNTVDNLHLATTLNGKKQKTAIKNLVKEGFVIQENRENNKRFFKIIADEELLKKHIELGLKEEEGLIKKQKEKREYTLKKNAEYKEAKKNLVDKNVDKSNNSVDKSGESVDNEKGDNDSKKSDDTGESQLNQGLFQNGITDYSKMEFPVIPKWSKNNNNINNNNLNNNKSLNSFNSFKDISEKEMNELNEIKTKCEIDLFGKDRNTLENVIDDLYFSEKILCDKSEFKQPLIRKKLLMLNPEILAQALGKLQNRIKDQIEGKVAPINNTRAFFKTIVMDTLLSWHVMESALK